MGPVEGVFKGLAAAGVIVPAPAWAAPALPPLSSQVVVLSALAAGGVALAIAAGLWALAEQRISRRLRRSLRLTGSRTKAALGERDALLGAGREPLVVWGRDGAGPFSYGGGEESLQSCLKGPDALALSAAIDGLSDRGAPFQIPVSDPHGRKLIARGRAVGSMVAVWLEEPTVAAEAADYKAILDALPTPVWLRDKGLAVTWGNHAFLAGAGANNLEELRLSQASLDKNERELAASARSRNSLVETRRFTVVNGQRRALSFTEIPLGDAGVIGTAVDVTDLASAEARLQSHVDAHADTLDKLETAVAIFGRDQKLSFHNRAFARLWGLSESFLDKHPSDGEVLEKLRETRKLPEQRDWQGWKRARLALYDAGRAANSEEQWHLPGGQTIKVITQPHPSGGLTYLYEDVSEKLALESSFQTAQKVQSATLDILKEGVAVFGPDGRLKFHNAAFARIWDFTAEELAREPHVREIAALAADRFGEAGVWEKLSSSILSGTAQKRELGEVERQDRTIVELALAPLPDGASLVTFADVTDRFRIEQALRDRGDALEAADKLKSDFIKHVSYELRTPLNTILGFSEHLATGAPGELNQRQREYVDAIVSGSNTLKNLVNDILDLALVESGALRLELGRVDLFEVLEEVASHAREWAGKMGLTLTVDVSEDAGEFLADARRLRQIVFNLLSNAFKFTPRGGEVTLTGRVVGEDVQITVADNGPGLSPDMKATVFERFSAKSRAGARAGAGLGLALVNRFLELHDGWVEIESAPSSELSGGGTVVRCHLPRRIVPGDDHPTHSEDKKTAYL
ncbi:MAG: PAS-domain containing protein [Alphaproteobacteria bacterium]|nr:PAS-domain containing protein [Alphaproteobacteria bacterium]